MALQQKLGLLPERNHRSPGEHADSDGHQWPLVGHRAQFTDKEGDPNGEEVRQEGLSKAAEPFGFRLTHT